MAKKTLKKAEKLGRVKPLKSEPTGTAGGAGATSLPTGTGNGCSG